MRTNKRPSPPPFNRGPAPLPPALANEMVALFNAGLWQDLEQKASSAAKRYPDQVFPWKALAKAQIYLGGWAEAVRALTRVTQLTPGDADAHNDLGTALKTLGRAAEAEASYRRALQLNPGFAMAHSNLGMLLADRFRPEEALASFRRSLALAPQVPETHNCMGKALFDAGFSAEAEASYRNALALNPNHFEAYVNLALTLKGLARFPEAEACCRAALELRPGSALALQRLGGIYEVMEGRLEEAIVCLERSLALDPADVDAYCTLGNILLRAGQVGKSMAMFRHAQTLRPLITWPANQAKAGFSALFLDSPGPGSTPVSYLAGKAPYDAHFYCVLPDDAADVDLLRSRADVVVNMVADADNGEDILPVIQGLVDRLGRPTVNPPGVVLGTDRETMAKRLAGLPLCRIPRTTRLAGSTLLAAAENGCLDGFSLPLLVRLAGNHGGDDFEKLDTREAILAFVARRPEANYYLAEYVDYRSADGLFRKYRWISVDGAIHPYHLAIHDDWKVHHFRTDMANQAALRQEELAFLQEPSGVFDEAHQAALRSVAGATGLNYCGIDCSLDQEGRIVVFETNAAMLVHDEKDPLFTYKNPYIGRIKSAFDAMLGRLAAGAPQAALKPPSQIK